MGSQNTYDVSDLKAIYLTTKVVEKATIQVISFVAIQRDWLFILSSCKEFKWNITIVLYVDSFSHLWEGEEDYDNYNEKQKKSGSILSA